MKLLASVCISVRMCSGSVSVHQKSGVLQQSGWNCNTSGVATARISGVPKGQSVPNTS